MAGSYGPKDTLSLATRLRSDLDAELRRRNHGNPCANAAISVTAGHLSIDYPGMDRIEGWLLGWLADHLTPGWVLGNGSDITRIVLWEDS